jgi:sporulation protein YlmC with PRC-barrel domain
VTGESNPSRLTNELDFTVWSQDGEQIGEVDEMVLDLDKSQVAYVVVGTGGFLDLGERKILVPWNQLELQTGTGDNTGGQQNAFILQTDVDAFRNAPNFDLSRIPQMGQAANDWDLDLRTYWENPSAGAGTGTGTDTGTATAAPGGAAVGTATTTTGTGAATVEATATTTTGTGAGAGTGTGTGQGQALQGVVLATDVLGSTINWGAQGQGTSTGIGNGQATATTEAGTGMGTATAAPGGAAVGTATTTTGSGGTGVGTDQGNTTGTIEDMIIDTDTGNIMYIVIMAAFADGERWIPVPLNLFQWNGAAGAFTLNVDATALQNAPSFADDQFPDTTTSGWNSEFDTFWQNNGGMGTGSTGTQATATP